MPARFGWTVALLAALGLLLTSCVTRGGRGGGGDDDDGADDDDSGPDDDDASPDDDDAGPDDDDAGPDDDDADPDDDDAGPDDDDAGPDDDDAGPDDDDVAPDDDDTGPPSGSFTGEYVITYWTDISAGVVDCEQHIAFEGSHSAGTGVLPACATCNARLDFDVSAFIDVSEAATDPDHCDPAQLTADGNNWGQELTDLSSYGDFANPMGLIDSAAQSSLGLDLAVGGGQDAASIENNLASSGLDYTHAGFVAAIPGTMGESAGLDAVASPAAAGSDYFAFWTLFVDPVANPNGGPALDGEYGGQALWIITLDAGTGISFTLTLTVAP